MNRIFHRTILICLLVLATGVFVAAFQSQISPVSLTRGQSVAVSCAESDISIKPTSARRAIFSCVPSAIPSPTVTPTPTPTPTPVPTPTPTPTPSPSGSPAEMPRVLLDSRMPTQAGIVREVLAGNSLQAAINAAQPGDIISLQAGATFTGNFILPQKTGAGWILIRSSALVSLPEGVRVAPSNASAMARIVAQDTTPAISTAPGAAFWRLAGLEITGPSQITTLVRLGDWAATNQAANASEIGIDRCWIHGTATSEMRRGVELQGARMFVVDSYLSDFHQTQTDSQAICGWNGAGPFKIVNNHLEAASENLLFGGADPKTQGLIPSDIEIRRNYFYKPLAWTGKDWNLKFSFELKNAQRVWVDGNILENCWPSPSGGGTAFALKSVNQEGGCAWCRTGDLTVTNNVVRNAAQGVSLLGTDASQPGVKMTRVLLRNNVFDTTGAYWAYVEEVHDTSIIGNTINNADSILQADNLPSQRFICTDNAFARVGQYGIKGAGAGSGTATLNLFFPGYQFVRNVLLGANPAEYPAGNYLVATPGTGADMALILAAQQRP